MRYKIYVKVFDFPVYSYAKFIAFNNIYIKNFPKPP